MKTSTHYRSSHSSTPSIVNCPTEEINSINQEQEISKVQGASKNIEEPDSKKPDIEDAQSGDIDIDIDMEDSEIEDANETVVVPETVAKEKEPTYVLRKVGEKTPPGTLKKSKDRPTSSCKSWCEQYSQTFLARTIDTPLPDPGPYPEDDLDDEQETKETL